MLSGKEVVPLKLKDIYEDEEVICGSVGFLIKRMYLARADYLHCIEQKTKSQFRDCGTTAN